MCMSAHVYSFPPCLALSIYLSLQFALHLHWCHLLLIYPLRALIHYRVVDTMEQTHHLKRRTRLCVSCTCGPITIARCTRKSRGRRSL